MPKKQSPPYKVNVDWAEEQDRHFPTLAEAQAFVLDLLQNGISLDGINMEDPEGRPLFLSAVKFELAK